MLRMGTCPIIELSGPPVPGTGEPGFGLGAASSGFNTPPPPPGIPSGCVDVRRRAAMIRQLGQVFLSILFISFFRPAYVGYRCESSLLMILQSYPLYDAIAGACAYLHLSCGVLSGDNICYRPALSWFMVRS